MGQLIELVRAYREAKTFREKTRCTEKIIRVVGPELRAFVLSCWPPGGIDDVFQETLDSLARGLPKFYGESDRQFWGWSRHVARNKVRDHLRKKKADRLRFLDTEELWHVIDAASQDQPISAGERLDLQYALDLLKAAKAPCVDYLWEHYVLGWDYAEMAREYGLAYDTMLRRITRCLELAQSLVAKRH